MGSENLDVAVTPISSASPAPPPAKRKFYIEREPISIMEDRKTPQERERSVEKVMALLLSWPNWEIWPFKVSLPMIGCASMMNGYILNKAFRSALLLGNNAHMSSYMATMGFPAVLSVAFHYMGITNDILSQKTGCPVCLQVRAACIQTGIAVVYPLIFAPVVGFTTASALKHFYFPKIHKDPMPTLRFVGETISSVKSPLMLASMAQIVIAMGLTYFQQDCFYSKVLPVVRGEVKLTKETRKKDFGGGY